MTITGRPARRPGPQLPAAAPRGHRAGSRSDPEPLPTAACPSDGSTPRPGTAAATDHAPQRAAGAQRAHRQAGHGQERSACLQYASRASDAQAAPCSRHGPSRAECGGTPIAWTYGRLDALNRSCRAQLLPDVFRAMLTHTIPHGGVHAVAPDVAGAIWVPPTAEVDEEAMADEVVEISADYAERVVTALELLGEHHPTAEAHEYLFILGTRATWQSRGLGSALLRSVTGDCDRDHVGACLERTQPLAVRTARLPGGRGAPLARRAAPVVHVAHADGCASSAACHPGRSANRAPSAQPSPCSPCSRAVAGRSVTSRPPPAPVAAPRSSLPPSG